jgi:hypothetical protein
MQTSYQGLRERSRLLPKDYEQAALIVMAPVLLSVSQPSAFWCRLPMVGD